MRVASGRKRAGTQGAAARAAGAPVPFWTRISVPTPFKVGPVNAYLIAGEPLTLIDAGPDTPEALAALEAGFAAAGRRLSELRRLIITHGHPDHWGLARRLADMTRCEVCAGAAELYKLTAGLSSVEARRPLLVRAGVPPAVLKELEAIAEKNKSYTQPLEAARVTVLEDGARLTVGERALHVISAPGHSMGLVCLYEPASRVLFSSDCILPRITPNPVLEPAEPGSDRPWPSLSNYLATLERLSALDVSIVLPGHGPPLDSLRHAIARIRRHHRRRLEAVAAALGPGPATAYEVAMRLFPDVRGWDVFFAVSEAVGHLEVMAEAWEAGVERVTG